MEDRLLEDHLMMKEMARLICDEHMGSGQTRDVWGSICLPEVVFKFEPTARSFANIAEWDFFGEYNELDHVRKWVAPCLAISPCGMVLMQHRCTPIEIDQLPDEIPSWITDMKLSNWGMMTDKEFGRRPVLVDYNLTIMAPSKRLKKSHWNAE